MFDTILYGVMIAGALALIGGGLYLLIEYIRIQLEISDEEKHND